MFYAYDTKGTNLAGAEKKETLEKILKDNNIKYAEITEKAPTTPEPTDAEKLAAAKQAAEFEIQEKLAATDYKCLKFVDGDLTAKEYETIKAERKALREKYNEIEAAITLEDLKNIID